jgi:hypothetical protein
MTSCVPCAFGRAAAIAALLLVFTSVAPVVESHGEVLQKGVHCTTLLLMAALMISIVPTILQNPHHHQQVTRNACRWLQDCFIQPCQFVCSIPFLQLPPYAPCRASRGNTLHPSTAPTRHSSSRPTPLCVPAEIGVLLELKSVLAARGLDWNLSFSSIDEFNCSGVAASGIRCDAAKTTIIRM